MLKRILVGLAAVAIGLGCLAALAWRTSIAPIAPPARSSFSPELVTRGEVLAAAGYCATCHTAKGGKPYAGQHVAVGHDLLDQHAPDPRPESALGLRKRSAVDA